MKYFRSIFVFLLSLFLLACGGNSNFTSNQQENITGAQSLQSKLSLEDNLLQEADIFLQGETIRFNLRLTNNSNESIKLEFDSGQQYEFYIVNSDNDEVWRWSSNILFTQAISEITIPVGQTLNFRESWNQVLFDEGRLPTGAYTAYGNIIDRDVISFGFSIQ